MMNTTRKRFIGIMKMVVLLIDEVYSAVWTHTDLNYNFSRSPGARLDAITVGNETRYINDGVNGPGGHINNQNVEVILKVVNGEHRLMFFAIKNIKAGAELLWDYGQGYWKPGENSSTAPQVTMSPSSSRMTKGSHTQLERIEEDVDELAETNNDDDDAVEDVFGPLAGFADDDKDDDYDPSSS